MTKVSEVVTDALEEIVVQSAEAKIEQADANSAIRALNDMMLAWAVDGIDLGYTVVADLGDDVTVALGAIRGIKANLAVELASRYEVQPSQSLMIRARDGKITCIDLSFEQSESVYPETLPRGSGNSYPDYLNSKFYPNQSDTILTETGGSIALEEDTET